jgi:hypothetical protein
MMIFSPREPVSLLVLLIPVLGKSLKMLIVANSPEEYV